MDEKKWLEKRKECPKIYYYELEEKLFYCNFSDDYCEYKTCPFAFWLKALEMNKLTEGKG